MLTLNTTYRNFHLKDFPNSIDGGLITVSSRTYHHPYNSLGQTSVLRQDNIAKGTTSLCVVLSDASIDVLQGNDHRIREDHPRDDMHHCATLPPRNAPLQKSVYAQNHRNTDGLTS